MEEKEKIEEEKKEASQKKKSSNGFVILMLGLVIIALVCFIGFKVLTGSNSNGSSGKDTETKTDAGTKVTDTTINDDSIKSTLKEKFDFMVYLFEGNVYCGENPDASNGRNFDINLNGSNTSHFIRSTQFKTYDELLNYVRNYMSDSVFSKHFGDKRYYQEADGYLYCYSAARGVTHQYNADKTTYEIKEQSDDKVVAAVTFTRDPFYEDRNGQKTFAFLGSTYEADVTMLKKSGNWQIDQVVVHSCKCIDDGNNLCSNSMACSSNVDDFVMSFGSSN